MKRIDWITEQMSLWAIVYCESEGSVKEVARAHLLDLLDQDAAMTAGEGQKLVAE